LPTKLHHPGFIFSNTVVVDHHALEMVSLSQLFQFFNYIAWGSPPHLPSEKDSLRRLAKTTVEFAASPCNETDERTIKPLDHKRILEILEKLPVDEGELIEILRDDSSDDPRRASPFLNIFQ
jgi:hypothetical protein